jgi:hypothetical protein
VTETLQQASSQQQQPNRQGADEAAICLDVSTEDLFPEDLQAAVQPQPAAAAHKKSSGPSQPDKTKTKSGKKQRKGGLVEQTLGRINNIISSSQSGNKDEVVSAQPGPHRIFARRSSGGGGTQSRKSVLNMAATPLRRKTGWPVGWVWGAALEKKLPEKLDAKKNGRRFGCTGYLFDRPDI